MPLPCRLEEQTRKLQKDLKKSTDADLGRWHVPQAGRGGARWMPSSLSHLRAGFEVSVLGGCPTDVPEKWPEVRLHLAEPHSPLFQAEPPLPPEPGAVLASAICATEPQAKAMQRTWARLSMTALTPGPSCLQTMCAASQGAAFGDCLLFVLKLVLSYLDSIFLHRFPLPFQ